MNRTGKDGPRVLRTRSGWPARRSWKVQTPPDPAELLRVGTTRGPFMVSTHVHPQVCALHEPDRQGRTAGPPDPQRLAGEEILESPNVLDAAELLRVGTTRGPFMVSTHVHPQVCALHEPADGLLTPVSPRRAGRRSLWLALLLCAPYQLLGQHAHLNAGAVGTNQNDQLIWANAADFGPESGYVKTLFFTMPLCSAESLRVAPEA